MTGTQLRGWYPDPSGAPRQRYWDGQQWTGHAPPRQTLTRNGLLLLIAMSTVVALILGGCSVMIAAASKSNTATADRFRGPTGVTGSRLTDGDFEFMVSEVSAPSSGRADPQPRGVWIIATTTVRNTDDEVQEFAADNQRLIASDGHVYAADAEAAVAMNNSSMLVKVAPGSNVTLKLPFDVPEGTLPAAIELHDSVFSNGARVRLSTTSAASLP